MMRALRNTPVPIVFPTFTEIAPIRPRLRTRCGLFSVKWPVLCGQNRARLRAGAGLAREIRVAPSFAGGRRHWRYERGGFSQPPGRREAEPWQAHVRILVIRDDVRNETHQPLPFAADRSENSSMDPVIFH